DHTRREDGCLPGCDVKRCQLINNLIYFFWLLNIPNVEPVAPAGGPGRNYRLRVTEAKIQRVPKCVHGWLLAFVASQAVNFGQFQRAIAVSIAVPIPVNGNMGRIRRPVDSIWLL